MSCVIRNSIIAGSGGQDDHSVTPEGLQLYDDDTLAPSADACEESSHPLPKASDSTAASGLEPHVPEMASSHVMWCALHRLMTTRS